MATITPVLDTSYQTKEGLYAIYVLIRHGKSRKKLPVGFRVAEKYWNGEKVSNKHPEADIINAKIAELEGMAKKYIADCKLHNKSIDISLIGTGRTSHSFVGYLQIRVLHYKEKKMHVQARKLSRYVIDLNECFGRAVHFGDITKESLRKFEEYLITQKNIANTRLRKFARLRQFFDNAIEEGLASGPNPFNSYHIQGTPSKKEKLTEGEIAAIQELELPAGPINDARNIFLFSYYCKGARFENCIMMLRAAVQDGRIGWRINKGKRFLSVKIHSKLQAILDQYSGDSDFIFPQVEVLRKHPRYGPVISQYIKVKGEIIEGKDPDYIKMIDVLNVTVGRYLDEVARLIELTKTLNFHIARHTFAFHLKKRTDSISVIQDSLGHKDQKTTEIYLQSLDDEQLDDEMKKLYGE